MMFFQNIANPAGITDVPAREKFEKLRGKLSEESQKGNTTANAILNAASSSVEAQHDITVVPA